MLDWSQYPVVDFVLIGGSSASVKVWMVKAWDTPIQNREFCITNGAIFEYVSTGPFENVLDTPFEPAGSESFTMAALNLEARPCKQIEGDSFFYLNGSDDLTHIRKIFSSISNLIELYKSEGSQSAESDENFDLFRSMSGPYQEWLLGLEIEAPSEIDFVENSLGRSAVEVEYIMGSNDYIEIYTFILLQEQETFKVTGFSWGQPHINK